PPMTFIPVAEDCGLIIPLGEWALREACRQATQWPAGMKVAVNLSPVQISSPNLVDRIARILVETGLSANRLELEITESICLDDSERTLSILQQFKKLGVHIVLDDFGTGYSSLSYLRRFPFDKIKVDRCFVTDIAEPDGSAGIVRAVVNIAAERDMTTTAEGVETEEQQRILRELGCSEMQGYLFS